MGTRKCYQKLFFGSDSPGKKLVLDGGSEFQPTGVTGTNPGKV